MGYETDVFALCNKVLFVVTTADDLVKKADVFKISSQNVKSRMWWKSVQVGVVLYLQPAIDVLTMCFV